MVRSGAMAIMLGLAITRTPVRAQTPAPRAGASVAALSIEPRVDSLVAAQMRERSTPGVSIAVMRNGALVRARGYGFANLEHRAPATPETIYQSGSIGKQFTATLVMLLVEEHRIGLDDPISRFLPEAPPAWQGVTIRHLLSHTAGISEKLYAQIDMRKDYTEDDLLRLLAAMPLDFPPGDEMRYSNPGYILLGILIHRVTGTFYGDLLRDRIFRPLGMTTARIIDEAAIIPHRAAGYRVVAGEVRNQEWVSPMLNTTADGSIYLTVRDLAKWDAALRDGRILKRSSLEQMWTPAVLNSGRPSNYGFGWFVDTINGHRIVEHSGSWQGFTSYIFRSLDDGLSVVVLTNSAGGNPGFLAHAIVALYEPRLKRTATAVASTPGDSTLQAFVGDYELRPNLILSITRDGDQLYSRATGQPRFRLVRESPIMFAVTEFAAKVEFVRDTSGRVVQLILHQDGEHKARRLP